MNIRITGTGSKGNNYILTDKNENHLLIDFGIQPLEIKKMIDFDVEHIVGCLVSHVHS